MLAGMKAVGKVAPVWNLALPVKMKFSEMRDEADIVEVGGVRLTKKTRDSGKLNMKRRGTGAPPDEVTVKDVDNNDNEDDGEFETDSGEETETEHDVESQPLMLKTQNLEVSTAQSSGRRRILRNIGTRDVVSNQEKREIKGTPGFTVYVNRRPTSMV
ncbi:hypothetical protein L2E82_02391 [Cichorium intybus]|uniref:Uncharacterized protein n=1 Tax=Cichorium intybus TaxID=13427 RepID=A0ACB9H264_CICIN|nr:hypothetical protein L2E82_02391 [Cichorium intybus]